MVNRKWKNIKKERLWRENSCNNKIKRKMMKSMEEKIVSNMMMKTMTIDRNRLPLRWPQFSKLL